MSAADDLERALGDFDRTAFRAELREAYWESGHPVLAFMAGHPVDPRTVPDYVEWDAHVARLTAAGRRVERVRVVDDPPSNYQRWVRWSSAPAIEAGEVVRYVPRPDLLTAGIDAYGDDWWLIDDRDLYVLRFGADDDKLIDIEHVTDPERVAAACAWRDVAVRLAAPDTAGVPS